MKRIFVSLLTITLVAIVGFASTRAFFSDTETSTGNTLAAGSIDISVDQNNPWSESGSIEDMKPSYVRWTRHEVTNVGDNPLKLWKHIKDVTTENNGWSESECSDAGGTWVASYSCTGNPQERNNIDEYIEYDMYIGGNVVGEGAEEANNWFGGHNEGGDVIIDEADGITVSDIESVFVYLGELAPAEMIVVWQSYHMKDETGNWAQTDKLTYTIEFYAEQVNGTGPISGGPSEDGPYTLLLENKIGTAWDIVTGDGIWGILKWAGDGDTFDFSTTLNAHGLAPSTNYSLIYYADGWPGDNPGALLGSGASGPGGDLTVSANPNLGIDMPDPADANHPTGAKIWLIPSSDYDSVNSKVIGWPAPAGEPPAGWLFEYNLIQYDDTNAP